MKKNILLAILALTGAAASAQAQVVAAYDDLILGFRASGGTGQTVSLEVDLGSITQFSNVASGTKFAVTRLSAADLASFYGANWATRTDLVWGVVGTTGRSAGGPGGQPAVTLWATKAELNLGTQSTPWIRASVFAQSVGSSAIEPLFLGSPGSLNGKTATSGSAYASAVSPTNSAGSYLYQDSVQAGESFDYFNPSVDNTTPGTATYAASDLYEVQPSSTGGNSNYLGTFGLKSDGTLTFSGSAAAYAPGAGDESFTTQPGSVTVVNGSTVALTAAATGTPTPTYQWYLNGAPLSDGGSITGSASARLVIAGAGSSNAGVYTVVARNTSGTATSNSATLAVTGSASSPGRLVNLSILSKITGSLTMGFVNGGSGTSGSEQLLIRAIGPAIGPGTLFNVPGVMSDPTLKVVQTIGGASVASNTGWGSNATAVTAADNATGAFPLTITSSADSALVTSVTPVGGGFGAQVSGQSGDSGFALTEVYDDTATYTASTPRLVNLSCLTNIPAGGNLNVGFVLGGTTAKTVLVRVSGPSIAVAPFNVAGTMPDPQLTVAGQTASSVVLASNAGWGGDTTIASIANTLGAFAFTSATSKDSAALVTLPPVNGGYSVTVSSASGQGGEVLVEVYEVP